MTTTQPTKPSVRSRFVGAPAASGLGAVLAAHLAEQELVEAERRAAELAALYLDEGEWSS